MKKTLTYLLLLICTVSFAQNREDQRPRMDQERMQAAKIAFLTEKLDLDTETAQEFWPIYNEFQGLKEEINKDFAGKAKEILGPSAMNRRERMPENLTDDQALSILTLMQERKEADFALEKDYMDKFLGVLGPQQVLTLYQFDAEFRRTLMKRFSEQSKKRRDASKSDGN